MELSQAPHGQAAGRFIGAELGTERTRDAVRLNVFQKTGLAGLSLIVAAAALAIILPPLAGGAPIPLLYAWYLFILGGPLLTIGIFGNLIFVIYRAGAENERRRLGLPPINR